MALETSASESDNVQEERSQSQSQSETTAATLSNSSLENPDPERELLPNTNIVTHCIYKNDPHRLIKCFEDDTDPYKEEVVELLNTRNDDGKSPLDIAACLGRLELTKELLARGADISSFNPKGYSCLHYAAAWGRLSVLKVLIENNGNLQQLNVNNERPIEVAKRYSQDACIDYLDWAEAKSLLQEAIRFAQESILDADKAVAGRITKEEKNISLSLCKEKQEWLDNTPDATTQDFITHRLSLNEVVEPVILKLNEPRMLAAKESERKDIIGGLLSKASISIASASKTSNRSRIGSPSKTSKKFTKTSPSQGSVGHSASVHSQKSAGRKPSLLKETIGED